MLFVPRACSTLKVKHRCVCVCVFACILISASTTSTHSSESTSYVGVREKETKKTSKILESLPQESSRVRFHLCFCEVKSSAGRRLRFSAVRTREYLSRDTFQLSRKAYANWPRRSLLSTTCISPQSKRNSPYQVGRPSLSVDTFILSNALHSHCREFHTRLLRRWLRQAF